MPYYVYILLCKGGTFYTGCTKNLNTRMKQHLNGKGAKYTKTHKPQKIAYIEEFKFRAKAMRREKSIKKLNHKQKLQLTKQRNKQNRTTNSMTTYISAQKVPRIFYHTANRV